MSDRMQDRKRYVLVGTGGRSVMFIDALAGKYRPHGELAAFCDVSPTRMAFYNRHLEQKWKLPPVPTFKAEQFDQMIAQIKPQVVIVCSMDSTHHQYIIRAMELGCDVICEKPMTIDAPKARAIFDAIQRTGRKLRVTFNYRYSPHVTKVRELIRDGAIGDPLAVDFMWVLDTRHGADYFRRWHAEKDKSGGLLVHKSTHHFDLINWWIDSYPQRVFAMGDLKFYGRKSAEARGDKHLTGYPRYTGYEQSANDPFAMRLDASKLAGVYSNDTLRGLYLEAEKDSGYIRDKNVFGEHVTIEDTMAVMARYRNGVIMNYSLVAYSPWEGFRAAITGNRGRVELYIRHGGHIIAGQSDEELAAEQAVGEMEVITMFPMFGMPQEIPVAKAEGGHGGGDPILLEQLFSPNPPADPFNRAASHIDGAASILMGIAANESIRTGMPVVVDDLLQLPCKSVPTPPCYSSPKVEPVGV